MGETMDHVDTSLHDHEIVEGIETVVREHTPFQAKDIANVLTKTTSSSSLSCFHTIRGTDQGNQWPHQLPEDVIQR